MKAFCKFATDHIGPWMTRGGPDQCRGMRGSRGITLLELLVVLAIIALIATFAVPALMNQLGASKTKAARIQVKELGSILDMYRLDVGGYPSEAEGLEALVKAPPGLDRWNGPYLKNQEALTDPWGRPYLYRMPGENGEYDLYTYGSDGAEGGEGEAADVTSW